MWLAFGCLTAPDAGAADRELKASVVRADVACQTGWDAAAVGKTLYFTGTDGTTGCELWKSDGTAAGTRAVKDVNLGAASSDIQQMTTVGNLVFFTAEDEYHGRELWRTDGTGAGTRLVKDITPDEGDGTSFRHLFNYKGTLDFFVAGRTDYDESELWSSSGSEAGTVVVKPHIPADSFWRWPDPARVGDDVYFTTYNPSALWKTRGSAGTTVKVKGFDVDDSPDQLVSSGGKLFFNKAVSDESAEELWVSEGTAANTKVVKDIRVGSNGSYPKLITPLNGAVYFTADDAAHGREVWRSDGTKAGTSLLKDVTASAGSSNILDVAVAHNRVYFSVVAVSDQGGGIWKSDGTTAGTSRFIAATSGFGAYTPAGLYTIGSFLTLGNGESYTDGTGFVGDIVSARANTFLDMRLVVSAGSVPYLPEAGAEYGKSDLVKLAEAEVKTPDGPKPPGGDKAPVSHKGKKCRNLRAALGKAKRQAKKAKRAGKRRRARAKKKKASKIRKRIKGKKCPGVKR